MIIVTGGAGFIGSHLCEKLLEQGNHIICLDNFFTGSRKNVEHLFDNREFELIRHDIIEPIILEVDQIYNLACPASPVHYQYNAIKTIKTIKTGRFVIPYFSQSGYSQSASLLAHNQIAATQLIRRGLPPPDTSKSPPLLIAFRN